MARPNSESFEKKIIELFREGGNLTREESSCEPKFKQVPQILYKNLPAREECFEPRVLFLGPFHKDKNIPKEAKQFKSKAAKLFIAKAGHEHCSQVFRWIFENINKFKKMYEEEEVCEEKNSTNQLELGGEVYMEKQTDEEDYEYAWMLFQDGCAASHVICTDQWNTDTFKNHEYISALIDVILLENQLPYEVLERLTRSDHNAVGASGSTKICSFLQLILFIFLCFAENKKCEEEAKNNNGAGAATSFNTTPPSPDPGPSPSPIATDTESSSDIQISIEDEMNNYMKEAHNSPVVLAAQDIRRIPRIRMATASIDIGNILKINNTRGNKKKQHHGSQDNSAVPPGPGEYAPPGRYVHLLHHLRARLEGATNKSTTTDASELMDAFSYTCRSAAQIRERGIHFKPSRSSRWDDVSFSKGWTKAYLNLPPIIISDLTKPMLLNLVADEMSSDVPNNLAVASYLVFLDSLIDSSDDVKILREANIINNCLGSDEEVATIFNEIGKNLPYSGKLYGGVQQKIQSHFNNKSKTWMAQLYHIYLGSPWTVFAFAGAILITYLTLLQSYLTMFPISDEDRTTEKKGLLYGLKHIYMLLALPLPLVVILLLLVSLYWFIKFLNSFCRKTK